MRYFRIASDAVYEQARLSMDAAWGHAPPVTCVDRAAVAPRDSLGRIVLAVNDEFCDYNAAADLLPQLLSSGAVVEIDADSYAHAVAIQLP